MSNEAERIPRVPFPPQGRATPMRLAPRPTGTLEAILAGIEAETPDSRLVQDLDRIERALARLERVMRLAVEGGRR
jgi:hypothetical protein